MKKILKKAIVGIALALSMVFGGLSMASAAEDTKDSKLVVPPNTKNCIVMTQDSDSAISHIFFKEKFLYTWGGNSLDKGKLKQDFNKLSSAEQEDVTRIYELHLKKTNCPKPSF